MYRGHRVAVVMPIHNEKDHLAKALSRVPPFVDLIIAVDDGSTDGTWERLARVRDEKLVRLRHEANRGVGAATKTGYLFCLRSNLDFIAVMDGDGQMDGRDLSGLLDCALGGADYVKGNRFLHRETISRMPVCRLIGNSVLSWMTRRAGRYDKSIDAQCGYTVIRRPALKRLSLESLYDRYGFPNEMFFAARRAGLSVESVAVRTVYEDEVSGINPATAVPTILYLIARSFFRMRFSFRTSPSLFKSEANSTK